MFICRSDVVRMLHERSGFMMKDIKYLLKIYDELIYELMSEVPEDDEVSIQAFQGIRFNCRMVGERVRRDPRDQKDIVVGPTLKPSAKFSEDFRININQRHNDANQKDDE